VVEPRRLGFRRIARRPSCAREARDTKDSEIADARSSYTRSIEKEGGRMNTVKRFFARVALPIAACASAAAQAVIWPSTVRLARTVSAAVELGLEQLICESVRCGKPALRDRLGLIPDHANARRCLLRRVRIASSTQCTVIGPNAKVTIPGTIAADGGSTLHRPPDVKAARCDTGHASRDEGVNRRE